MPSFNVDIDKWEILAELSDTDLIDELKERQPNFSFSSDKEKRELLNTVSDFLRKSGRLPDAVRIDDLREELNL